MSAAVLAVLVILWLVVLVPMLLRRHDRNAELAGADRFAGAMRVLSRRRGRSGGLVDRRFLLGRPAPSAERAAVISRALARTPDTAPPRAARPVPPEVRARRRAARVAARRRGLVVLIGSVALTAVLALALSGFWWALQGLTDVLAIAGLAQIRASAVADRASVPPARSSGRPAATLTDAPVSPRQPMPEENPRVRAAMPERPAAQALPYAAGHDVAPPVARGAGKQIVFDAVSEAPIVAAPSVRTVPPKPTRKPVWVGVPVDFVEGPVAPPAPERVRTPYVPLLDAVDTDPETMTQGLELLDGILDRASGQ